MLPWGTQPPYDYHLFEKFLPGLDLSDRIKVTEFMYVCSKQWYHDFLPLPPLKKLTYINYITMLFEVFYNACDDRGYFTSFRPLQ